MGLLELLKDRLTPNVVEKISGFLGETPDDITVALNASLPTMFTGVEIQAAKENGVNKIMDIIKEGGHTGDLLDDIPTLLGNFDKTQLLVTIGSNIFNHFFGNNSNLLIEKVASLSGIRKTSASSLLGLSAPLVLGAYGKAVHRENLGISGLQALINEQHESIAKALPPSIAHILPQKTTPKTAETTVEHKVSENKSKTDKKNKDNQLGKIFPWLLLLLLALAAAYYLRSCRIKPSEESVALTTDSTEVAPTTLPEDEPSTKEVTTTKEETNSTNSASESAASKETQPTKEEVETPKKVEKPKETTNRTTENEDRETRSTSTGFSSSSLTTGNWISFSNNLFRSSNSAEVNASSSEIRALANYLLQHPNASVTLSPLGSGRLANDRAYAIQGALYDQGIDISRVKVGSSRSGNGSVALHISR